MALTAEQVAELKTKWQYFTVELCAFPAIPFSIGSIPAAGAITWKPFCLLSPRFSYTSGDAVTISGTDSYIRPTTAVATVAFSVIDGPGTLVDNGDKTCTVTPIGVGTIKIQAIATSGGQTHTAYAYVYSGNPEGNLRAVVSRIEGFSGNFDNGEWKADVVLRGDYSGILTNDGRDQPILMHTVHFWDGVADTFGGYVRHNNTFVLLCRESEIRVKHAHEYETVLHMETPAYAIKRRWLNEMKFSPTAGSGIYSSASLTMSDVVYFLMRHATNLADYFNVSVWNNAATLPANENLVVPQGTNVWEAVRSGAGRNFGIAFFDRWGSLLVKPDPRIRIDEWNAISSNVYEGAAPLDANAMLEYTIYRRRTDNVSSVNLQAKLPGGQVANAGSAKEGYLGDFVEVDGLIATSGSLGTYALIFLNAQNLEYFLDFTLPMGHELNPGDIFIPSTITPPIGGAVPGMASWLVTDTGYEFDFTRGFWVRRIGAQTLPTGGA